MLNYWNYQRSISEELLSINDPTPALKCPITVNGAFLKLLSMR